jgi:hypothetical protein
MSSTRRNDIAAEQFSVDGEVEQREIAAAALKLHLVRIDQTWLARSGGFAPISLPLFQG